MDADARAALRRRLALGLGSASLVAAVVAVAPVIVERALRGPPTTATPADAGAGGAALSSFLTRALAEVGATATTAGAPLNGTGEPQVYHLPPGADARAAAEQVRQAAQAHDIELYVTPRGERDAELRLYDGKALAGVLLLRPAVAELVRAPSAPTLRERPLLAVVVAGLGDAPARALTDASIPLTLAIEPFAPWSLRTAEDAMVRWHEVLVDLEDGPDAPAPQAQLSAVPYASGVVQRSEAAPSAVPAGGVRVRLGTPSSGEGDALPDEVWALDVTGSLAHEAVAQGMARAAERGVATVVLDAGDAALPHALEMLQHADALGYRLILASEAARWGEVRGAASDAPTPSDG